ncbi:hypothetical protein FRP1_29335 (plasmid) [Pseudonocardia sp. EC080625-04]|nr:hypothetical protein FRP1_29335 [Pseudonocardia sp. EC080625-04]ALL85837.1 hypothetical protein AD017_32300 [Pseudonocardia sp. EC080619-01]
MRVRPDAPGPRTDQGVVLEDPAARLTSAGEPPQIDKDQARLVELKAAGLTGPVWDQFVDELWADAYPILIAGLRDGRIFSWCFEKNVMVNPSTEDRRILHSSAEDRISLAIDTLLVATPKFRDDVLAKDRWKPGRGATLMTFFVNHALFHFQPLFRAWVGEREHRLDRFGYNLDSREAARALMRGAIDRPDPELRALTEDTVERILRGRSGRDIVVCQLIKAGYSQGEIADMIGGSVRAVEGTMARLRRHARNLARRGVITMPGIAPDLVTTRRAS